MGDKVGTLLLIFVAALAFGNWHKDFQAGMWMGSILFLVHFWFAR